MIAICAYQGNTHIYMYNTFQRTEHMCTFANRKKQKEKKKKRKNHNNSKSFKE